MKEFLKDSLKIFIEYTPLNLLFKIKKKLILNIFTPVFIYGIFFTLVCVIIIGGSTIHWILKPETGNVLNTLANFVYKGYFLDIIIWRWHLAISLLWSFICWFKMFSSETLNDDCYDDW